jgi:hypothetical protein
MNRTTVIATIGLIFLYSNALFAADIEFDPFFKSAPRLYTTQNATTVQVNRVDFHLKTWTGGEHATVLFTLKVSGVDNRKMSCRYQLEQGSVEEEGRKRSFVATLAMPLNKKGVVQKPAHETYCKENVAINNVNLYFIHKHVMGVEISFSPSDTYRGTLQYGSKIPRYFLEDDPNADIARLFAFKVLTVSAFSNIDYRHYASWLLNSDVLHSEVPSPLSSVQLSAAGGVTAGEGEYSGLGLLRLQPLPGKKFGDGCNVKLSSATVKDQGNILSFKATTANKTPECQTVVSRITAFDLYAITPTLLGLQVNFDDQSWIRTSLSLRQGGQQLNVDPEQTQSYARLFTAPETSAPKDAAPVINPSNNGGSQQVNTTEFGPPQDSFWQYAIWQQKPFGIENLVAWMKAGTRYGKTKTLKFDSGKMSITYGMRLFSITIDPLDRNLIGLTATGSCSKGIHVVNSTHTPAAWKDYIEEPNIKNMPGIETSLAILRKAFESFCGTLVGFRLEMHHLYGTGIFKKEVITARATYGASSQWQLVDGFIEEAPINLFRYTLTATEPYLRLANHTDYCTAEPELSINVNRHFNTSSRTYEPVPVDLYTSMVSKVVDNYLLYCKQASKMTIFFSEQPSYRWCEDDRCRITLTKAQQWETDFSATFKEYYPVKHYGDVIAAYQGGYVKGLNVSGAYLAGFHRNFIEVYAAQCRAMIPELITMTFQAVEQDIIGGVVWNEKKVGPPRSVTIDSRARRAWGRAENSFNFRTVFSAVMSGKTSSVLTSLDEIEKNAQWLKGFVRENGCSSNDVTGFYNAHIL